MLWLSKSTHEDYGLRVLAVDTEKIFLSAFSIFLQRVFPNAKISVAVNGTAAFSMIQTRTFDIVFLGLNTIDIHCVHLLPKIHQKNQKVIALTNLRGKAIILRSVRLGLHGFINKQDDPQELIGCIDTVLAGQKYFNTYSRKMIFDNIDAMSKLPNLYISENDVAIIDRMRKGMTSEQIGRELGITGRVVAHLREEMFRKTKTTNMAELIAFCYENQVVPYTARDASLNKIQMLGNPSQLS